MAAPVHEVTDGSLQNITFLIMYDPFYMWVLHPVAYINYMVLPPSATETP
jgi:hypothetical protein